MSRDSDLYGEDIRLWSETQGALLRRLAAGEAVTDQVDWPHVIEEVEDLGRSDAQHLDRQQEIARLTALLAAAEARAKELRARLDDLTGKLSDAEAELAAVQDQANTAGARAVTAVEAVQQTEACLVSWELRRWRSTRWPRTARPMLHERLGLEAQPSYAAVGVANGHAGFEQRHNGSVRASNSAAAPERRAASRPTGGPGLNASACAPTHRRPPVVCSLYSTPCGSRDSDGGEHHHHHGGSGDHLDQLWAWLSPVAGFALRCNVPNAAGSRSLPPPRPPGSRQAAAAAPANSTKLPATAVPVITDAHSNSLPIHSLLPENHARPH